jgi:N-methylhydantoinase B/oxoprolinase/acetone carboxylase alpha subunit
MTAAPLHSQKDLLDFLRTKVRAPIEKHADEILDSFGDDNEGLAAFQRARADLDTLISRLEHKELQGIAKLLDSHAEELRTGIADLHETLAKAETYTRAARVFWRVVGLAARIVALA